MIEAKSVASGAPVQIFHVQGAAGDKFAGTTRSHGNKIIVCLKGSIRRERPGIDETYAVDTGPPPTPVTDQSETYAWSALEDGTEWVCMTPADRYWPVGYELIHPGPEETKIDTSIGALVVLRGLCTVDAISLSPFDRMTFLSPRSIVVTGRDDALIARFWRAT